MYTFFYTDKKHAPHGACAVCNHILPLSNSPRASEVITGISELFLQLSDLRIYEFSLFFQILEDLRTPEDHIIPGLRIDLHPDCISS